MKYKALSFLILFLSIEDLPAQNLELKNLSLSYSLGYGIWTYLRAEVGMLEYDSRKDNLSRLSSRENQSISINYDLYPWVSLGTFRKTINMKNSDTTDSKSPSTWSYQLTGYGATYYLEMGRFSPSFGVFVGKWQFADSKNPTDPKREFIQFSTGICYRIRPKWVLQGNIVRELLSNEFKTYDSTHGRRVNAINRVVIWNATLSIIFYPFAKGENT